MQTQNRGKTDSVEQAISDFSDTIRRVTHDVWRSTGCRLDRDDLRQEVMIGFFKAWQRKDCNPDAFAGYAVKRMYGHAHDYARIQLSSLGTGRRKYKQFEHVDIDDHSDIIGEGDPLDICAARQIIGMLDGLGEDVRSIIWAVHVDEMRYEDIGKKLGYVNGSGPFNAKRKAVNQIKKVC